MQNTPQTNVDTRSHQTKTRTEANADLSSVGEGIVSRLSSVLDHKVSVTNLSGNIVADSDLENFDKFVPSSVSAIQKGAPEKLPANEIDEMSGWVIPLRHQEKLFGTLVIRNKPAPDDDVIPLAKSIAELLIYQMLVMDKVARENRVLDKFFYDLLENRQPKEKLLRDSLFFNSQFFRIDFSEPRVSSVLVLDNFWKDVLNKQPILPADEYKLTAIKDKIKNTLKENIKTDDPIVVYLGMDEFAIMLPYKEAKEQNKKSTGNKNEVVGVYTKDSLEQMVENLSKKLNRDVYLGIGEYNPEIKGLVESYEGAKKAVHLGHKLQPEGKVFFYRELLLPIMLSQADDDLKKEFVNNELSDLIDHPDLIKTLSTHFDSNLNLKKTAYELGIHKNTLYYRLAKVKKILHIDPQEFNQAIRLKTALYLWRMEKEETTPE